MSAGRLPSIGRGPHHIPPEPSSLSPSQQNGGKLWIVAPMAPGATSIANRHLRQTGNSPNKFAASKGIPSSYSASYNQDSHSKHSPQTRSTSNQDAQTSSKTRESLLLSNVASPYNSKQIPSTSTYSSVLSKTSSRSTFAFDPTPPEGSKLLTPDRPFDDSSSIVEMDPIVSSPPMPQIVPIQGQRQPKRTHGLTGAERTNSLASRLFHGNGVKLSDDLLQKPSELANQQYRAYLESINSTGSAGRSAYKSPHVIIEPSPSTVRIPVVAEDYPSNNPKSADILPIPPRRATRSTKGAFKPAESPIIDLTEDGEAEQHVNTTIVGSSTSIASKESEPIKIYSPSAQNQVSSFDHSELISLETSNLSKAKVSKSKQKQKVIDEEWNPYQNDGGKKDGKREATIFVDDDTVVDDSSSLEYFRLTFYQDVEAKTYLRRDEGVSTRSKTKKQKSDVSFQSTTAKVSGMTNIESDDDDADISSKKKKGFRGSAKTKSNKRDASCSYRVASSLNGNAESSSIVEVENENDSNHILQMVPATSTAKKQPVDFVLDTLWMTISEDNLTFWSEDLQFQPAVSQINDESTLQPSDDNGNSSSTRLKRKTRSKSKLKPIKVPISKIPISCVESAAVWVRPSIVMLTLDASKISGEDEDFQQPAETSSEKNIKDGADIKNNVMEINLDSPRETQERHQNSKKRKSGTPRTFKNNGVVEDEDNMEIISTRSALKSSKISESSTPHSNKEKRIQNQFKKLISIVDEAAASDVNGMDLSYDVEEDDTSNGANSNGININSKFQKKPNRFAMGINSPDINQPDKSDDFEIDGDGSMSLDTPKYSWKGTKRVVWFRIAKRNSLELALLHLKFFWDTNAIFFSSMDQMNNEDINSIMMSQVAGNKAGFVDAESAMSSTWNKSSENEKGLTIEKIKDSPFPICYFCAVTVPPHINSATSKYPRRQDFSALVEASSFQLSDPEKCVCCERKHQLDYDECLSKIASQTSNPFGGKSSLRSQVETFGILPIVDLNYVDVINNQLKKGKLPFCFINESLRQRAFDLLKSAPAFYESLNENIWKTSNICPNMDKNMFNKIIEQYQSNMATMAAASSSNSQMLETSQPIQMSMEVDPQPQIQQILQESSSQLVSIPISDATSSSSRKKSLDSPESSCVMTSSLELPMTTSDIVVADESNDEVDQNIMKKMHNKVKTLLQSANTPNPKSPLSKSSPSPPIASAQVKQPLFDIMTPLNDLSTSYKARPSIYLSSSSIPGIASPLLSGLKSSAVTLALDGSSQEKASGLRDKQIFKSTLLKSLSPPPVLGKARVLCTFPKPTKKTDESNDNSIGTSSASPANQTSSVGTISILQADVDRLEPGVYLNDTLIDFYLQYIKLILMPEKDRSRVWIFSTHFYTKFVEHKYEKVSTWSQGNNIFDYDFIIIPINSALHWKVAVVYNVGKCKEPFQKKAKNTAPIQQDGEENDIEKPKDHDDNNGAHVVATGSKGVLKDASTEVQSSPNQPCIILFDSLGGIGRSGVSGHIRSFLSAEAQRIGHKVQKFDVSNLPQFLPSSPQQDNATDCGVFLLHYMELFCCNLPSLITMTSFGEGKLYGPDWFSIEEIPIKRRKINRCIQNLIESS